MLEDEGQKTALFVYLPFSVEDLLKLHFSEQRRPYAIEKTIVLKRIDYENLIWDLCVSRDYIEENARLCRIDETGVYHCILVQQRGKKDGILIMSDKTFFPKYAAYYCVE